MWELLSPLRRHCWDNEVWVKLLVRGHLGLLCHWTPEASLRYFRGAGCSFGVNSGQDSTGEQASTQHTIGSASTFCLPQAGSH